MSGTWLAGLSPRSSQLSVALRSDAPKEQEDDQDQDNEAKPARRRVAPTAAMAPGRQRTDQREDQDDE